MIYIGIIVSVCKWSGRPGFNPRSRHTKDSKIVLDNYLLNIIRYGSKVSGAIQGKEWHSPLGVVAIQKEPSGCPRLLSANIYICIYMSVCIYEYIIYKLYIIYEYISIYEYIYISIL